MTNPVQAIVAAFSNPTEAQQMMDDLKQGRRDGLIGIIDAAVVVKDVQGKLKITDAKRRSRRTKGLLTGGVVGGLVGLLAGPVGWAALGGGAIGALGARLAGAPMKATMQGIGEALPPNSSAIVAVIEHTWVAAIEQALVEEGAMVLRSAIAADIAATLQEGGNVLYTIAESENGVGAARVSETAAGADVVGVIADAEGVTIIGAEFTDEAIIEGEATETSAAPTEEKA
jgi:uncharacterized membrane protein